MIDKSLLRGELIKRRREMDGGYKSAADKDIFFQLMPLLEGASSVLTFVSTEIEVDTRTLISYCFEKKILLAVPFTGEREITFFRINSLSELEKSRHGILEPIDRKNPFIPDEKSLCVVPCLCADGNGNRLGYGGGYYDRFLKDFCGKSVIVCYRDFKREVPLDPHDIKAQLTIFDNIR